MSERKNHTCCEMAYLRGLCDAGFNLLFFPILLHWWRSWAYEFDLQHQKGKDNQGADALSRIEIKNPVVHINEQSAPTLAGLRQAQHDDSEIAKILQTGNITYPYILKDGVLCYIKYDPPVLVVVPGPWRQQFLTQIHQHHPTGGHLGREKTLARAKENAYWPTINQDVKMFIQKCRSCQMYKSPTHKIQQLKSIKVGGPGERWAADIAFLPVTERGNCYLLVCMDYLTKWMVTVALPSFDSDAIASALIHNIILQAIWLSKRVPH